MDLLLAAAIVPAAVLLWYVYQVDPVEKEPVGLLGRLLIWGAVACIPAILLETLGTDALMGGRPAVTIPDLLLENFIVIALSEELCKFFFLYVKTWRNPAFDYVFDGIVYGVFVSLGFAILENIGYVMEYGIATAVVRAFTAIPGHAIFGVFMGCFYGLAKRAEHEGDQGRKAVYLVCAIVVPVLCHGFYDFCASLDYQMADLVFLAFLVGIMVVAMRLVKHIATRADFVHAGEGFTMVEIDSEQYNPLIDNSLDEDASTYGTPSQFGSMRYPQSSSGTDLYSPDQRGPFSKG